MAPFHLAMNAVLALQSRCLPVHGFGSESENSEALLGRKRGEKRFGRCRQLRPDTDIAIPTT